MSNILNSICEQALKEGQKIDLKGCIYGTPHWDGRFVDEPYPHYFFLAGFVRSQCLTHIFDIGTHYGGSIMAMSRGSCVKDIRKNKLVTVDITYENEEGFKEFPHIKRIQGDVLNKSVVKQVVKCFDRNIDLIFIDSVHEHDHVELCIATYANILKPKYIILDDISLNHSMKRLWLELTKEFRERALDIAAVSGRSEEVGFGIIDWEHTYRRNWRYKEIKLRFLSLKIMKSRISNAIK